MAGDQLEFIITDSTKDELYVSIGLSYSRNIQCIWSGLISTSSSIGMILADIFKGPIIKVNIIEWFTMEINNVFRSAVNQRVMPDKFDDGEKENQETKVVQGALDNGRSKTPASLTFFSKESQELLSGEVTSTPVNIFLNEHGDDLYKITLGSLKTYPENLALKVENRSTSKEDRSAAQHALNEREFNAFGKFSKQSPPDMKMYFEKYIAYLDSLSPEERNSNRYFGQRELAVSTYEKMMRDGGEEPEDLSVSQDPILSLLEALMERELKVKDFQGFQSLYEEVIDIIINQSEDEKFTTKANEAQERFDTMQSVIVMAQNGDDQALEKLTALVNNPEGFNDFLDYAKKLTTSQ